MPTRAFVDTSFLMEFKPVREIDWKPLLETDEDVIVVVAPIVTKELRNHKNGKDPRKSARARTAMQELAALRKTKQVEGRPGVTIGFCGNPSRALMEEHLLEWDQGDDQLLGSMLKERTRTTDRIVLIADDSNLLQHAEQLRFEAVEPPDKYERRPESDPRDAKIKKLEEAVRQHEDKHAKLSLTFPDGSQELQSPPLRLVDATKLAVEYTQEMIHARQQVNEMEPWGSFREQQGALRSGREQHRGLDLSEWMHKWQEAAQIQAREEALIARTFRAELWLANDGLEEAESVRVYLTIPEGVEAVNKPTRFQQFPEYPNWRHNKGDIWQQFAERMPIFRARPME